MGFLDSAGKKLSEGDVAGATTGAITDTVKQIGQTPKDVGTTIYTAGQDIAREGKTGIKALGGMFGGGGGGGGIQGPSQEMMNAIMEQTPNAPQAPGKWDYGSVPIPTQGPLVPVQATAPTIQMPNAPTAAQINPATLPAYNAASVQLPSDMQTAQVGPIGNIQGANVALPGAMQAANIGFNTQQQYNPNALSAQNDLIRQLSAQAQGQGPSVAANQFRQAQEANVAAVMAQLASQRGGPSALAQRSAMQTGADIQAQTARDAATARLQEQLAAQGLLGQTTAAATQAGIQQRGQDIGLATTQAGLEQEARGQTYGAEVQKGLTEAEMRQQADVVNQAVQRDVAMANAQFKQDTAKTVYGAGIEKALTDAQNINEANKIKYTTEAQIAQHNADLQQQATLAGYDAQIQGAIKQAGLDLEVIMAKFGADTQAAQQLFAATQQAVATNAQLYAQFQDLNVKYAAMGMDAAKSKTQALLDIAALQQGAQIANAQASAAKQSTNNQLLGSLIGAGGAILGGYIGGPAGAVAGGTAGSTLANGIGGVSNQQRTGLESQSSFVGPPSSASTMYGTANSDENLKTDIKAGDAKLGAFLDAINANEYVYKDKRHGSGRYISPMAQELERTEIGKDMVIDAPHGKMVDYARAAGTILSAQALIHKRLKELEKKAKN